MLGFVTGRQNAVMSQAELRAGIFFFPRRYICLLFCLQLWCVFVFNTDILHYLPSCVLKPACCEPIVSISYGSLGIFFRWRGCSPSCSSFNSKLWFTSGNFWSTCCSISLKNVCFFLWNGHACFQASPALYINLNFGTWLLNRRLVEMSAMLLVFSYAFSTCLDLFLLQWC